MKLIKLTNLKRIEMYKNISDTEILKLLADCTVDIGGRDDIAMYLAEQGQIDALETLHQIASNPKCENDIELIGQCGESLARIMCRHNYFDIKYIQDLLPYKWGSALHSAIKVIKQNKPDWYNKYELHKLEEKPVLKHIIIKKN